VTSSFEINFVGIQTTMAWSNEDVVW